ncbi:MAG TPA: 2OG-Fe(II) oxygenase, partial [Rhodopila sp.]|nr:2OG-Fe(II) oxygenase [Rhodopila sp.]
LEYRREKLQPSFVVDLLTALCAVDQALAFRAVVHILTLERVYDMDAILVPAARALLEHFKDHRPEAVEQLRLACLEHLRARIAEPLEPFPDWRRPHEVPCGCPLCTQLSLFLADPGVGVWRLKAKASDRDHVEETIRKARCDVDTVTERRGSPHSLICTKNEASFERRSAQRAQDLKDVAALG